MDKDIDEVMAIWLSTTISAHDFIDKEYWKKAESIVRTEYVPKAETYVYLVNGKIVGFISILSEDTVGALFIAREYQGQGLGSQLMEYVKEKYNVLAVSVYEKNKEAICFYQRHGFMYDYKQNDMNTGEVELVFIYILH